MNWLKKYAYLMSDTKKYVWYAKVNEKGLPSIFVFLIREVRIKSPLGARATLNRNSKLQVVILFKDRWGAESSIDMITAWSLHEPVRPNLEIFFRRLQDEISKSFYSSVYWERWRIVINRPETVPCKSMFLKISMCSKLHICGYFKWLEQAF